MRMYIWCLMMVGETSDEDVHLVFDDGRCDFLIRLCIWCVMMVGATSDEDVYLMFEDKRYYF